MTLRGPQINNMPSKNHVIVLFFTEPGEPLNLTAVGSTSTSIMLEWNKPSDLPQKVNSYKVYMVKEKNA
jgi:hypothetical protein